MRWHRSNLLFIILRALSYSIQRTPWGWWALSLQMRITSFVIGYLGYMKPCLSYSDWFIWIRISCFPAFWSSPDTHLIDFRTIFCPLHYTLSVTDRAQQMGQHLAKIPFEERSWHMAFKTRPNATMSRNFGLDMKQLHLQGRISNNHSGDVSIPGLAKWGG